MKINFFAVNVLAFTSAATDLKSQPTKVMNAAQTDADLASSYENWDQTAFYNPLELAQKKWCPNSKIRSETKYLKHHVQLFKESLEALKDNTQDDQYYEDHIYDKNLNQIEAMKNCQYLDSCSKVETLPADCKFFDYTYDLPHHKLIKGNEIGLDKLAEKDKALQKETAIRKAKQDAMEAAEKAADEAAEKLRKEKEAEKKRIAKEKADEKKRIAKEKADAEEKLKREQEAEKKRIAKEKADEEKRIAKEKADEEKRIADAKAAKIAADLKAIADAKALKEEKRLAALKKIAD